MRRRETDPLTMLAIAAGIGLLMAVLTHIALS